MKAYLDVDIVSAIVKGDNLSEYNAIERLLTAYDQGRIELYTSQVTHDEIKSCQGTVRAQLERVFRIARRIPIAPWDLLAGINIQGDRPAVFNAPLTQSDTTHDALLKLNVQELDAQHVLAAAKESFGYFLTVHRSSLCHAAEIKTLCGVDVQKPSDFIAKKGW